MPDPLCDRCKWCQSHGCNTHESFARWYPDREAALAQPAAPAADLHWDLALGSRAEQEGTPQPPSVEALADALPQHRTCQDDISGHESCLRIARKQWANLRRGS
jgi:hypothetical protein